MSYFIFKDAIDKILSEFRPGYSGLVILIAKCLTVRSPPKLMKYLTWSFH